jgi:hypothetical protein
VGYEKNIDRNNKSGKVENEILGETRIKVLHLVHCIDEGNAAKTYLVGHRSIKVKDEIITQAMILRLLLMTGYHLHKKTCILCSYDGWLWPQICKKEKGYL